MDEKPLTRSFISIDFPDEIIKEVARIQSILSKTGFTGKLSFALRQRENRLNY